MNNLRLGGSFGPAVLKISNDEKNHQRCLYSLLENLGDEPTLASPYDLAEPMARWAFTIFVDAIIFIDCNIYHFSHFLPDIVLRTDLCDFLNVSDGLEP